MEKLTTLKVNGENIPVKQTSSLYSLNTKDILRSLLIAVATPVLAAIATSLNAGEIKINWQSLLQIGISAAAAYLIKNFFTPSEVVLDKKDVLATK